MIKHIISFLILGAVLYVLFFAYAYPEDFCYIEGKDDIFYNPQTQITKEGCASSPEDIRIKERSPFVYFLTQNDTLIGFVLFFVGGSIFLYKKRKYLNKNKTATP